MPLGKGKGKVTGKPVKKRIDGVMYNTYLARHCRNCGLTVYLDRKPRTKEYTICPRCGQKRMELIREVG